VPITKILTDGLLENALPVNKILDVGCGCGYSSILAAKFKNNECTCVDINYLAVLATKLNAIWNFVCDKVSVIHSDFSEYSTNKCFDIIICNPPMDNDNKAKSLKAYHSLKNKHTNACDMRSANNLITDHQNISLVDRIFMSKLLGSKSKVIISSGNIGNNRDSIIVNIAQNIHLI